MLRRLRKRWPLKSCLPPDIYVICINALPSLCYSVFGSWSRVGRERRQSRRCPDVPSTWFEKKKSSRNCYGGFKTNARCRISHSYFFIGFLSTRGTGQLPSQRQRASSVGACISARAKLQARLLLCYVRAFFSSIDEAAGRKEIDL